MNLFNKKTGAQLRIWSLMSALMGAVFLPAVCGAQSPAAKIIGGYLSPGAYFFSASSARSALGPTKFYDETRFYAKKAHRWNMAISGGIEILSASDHYLPFTSGNDFSLFGASFRVTTADDKRVIHPYFSAGVFVGHIRSEALALDTTQLVPAAAIGVDWKFARYFTLGAAYHLNGNIGHIDTNGFSIMLKIF